MAYIKSRKQSDGTTRYTAVIRLRKDKVIVHQEAKTFTHRSAAGSWAKHREIELENPAALLEPQDGNPTLAKLIRWYIDTFEKVSKWQRTKQSHLEFLEVADQLGNANHMDGGRRVRLYSDEGHGVGLAARDGLTRGNATDTGTKVTATRPGADGGGRSRGLCERLLSSDHSSWAIIDICPISAALCSC